MLQNSHDAFRRTQIRLLHRARNVRRILRMWVILRNPTSKEAKTGCFSLNKPLPRVINQLNRSAPIRVLSIGSLLELTQTLNRSHRDSLLSMTIPRSEIAVGGSLSFFMEEWERFTEDRWILSVIQEGYLIPFISLPPLTTGPIDMSSRHPAMSEVISSLLKKNAIERVLNPNS